MKTNFGKLKVNEKFTFNGGPAVFEKASDFNVFRISDGRLFTYNEKRFYFNDRTEVFTVEDK